jgi:hypothetical protein
LGLAFGFCIHARPNLEEITKLAWLDEIDVIINKAIARLKPQAAVFAVDPAAAARVTEDLDYRIAQRIGSVEGWRSFLTVHGSGVHAQTATGEVERLLVSEQASAQTTAKVSNETSLGAKAAGDPVRPAPLSSGTEVAALTPESGVGSLGHETPVTAAKVSYGASSDSKAESETLQPAPPSSGMQIATPTPDENRKPGCLQGTLRAHRRRSIRGLFDHLRICVPMKESPSIRLTMEYHGDPVVSRRGG